MLLGILLLHCGFLFAQQTNITYGEDVFVLTRRDNTSAGYALFPKTLAENTTNSTAHFTAYFMNLLVRQGNLLAEIDPVAMGRQLSVTGNVTLIPRKIVERGPGGEVGATVNVDRHEQGWYNINTGTLKLPADFGELSPELVDQEATIASVRYISNTTDAQGRNTTVDVTAIFLPDLVLEKQNAVSIALLFSISNFPFQFNSSQLALENSLTTFLNATNTTMVLPVTDYFGFGNGSANFDVKTTKNVTTKGTNSTLYLVEQQVTAVVSASNSSETAVNILEAFMVKRQPFNEALKSEKPQISSATQSYPIHPLFLLLLLWICL